MNFGSNQSYIRIAWRSALLLSPLTLFVYPPTGASALGGEKFIKVPEVVHRENSQTMDLLEGYLNTNPTGIGGPDLAIVDGVALVHEGDASTVFVDASFSGGQISTYIVREGDTLSSIAKMFDVSVATITWANDIKNNTIRPGQELVILPISGVRHTVKSGDTLKTIASKYGAEVEDILAYNDISADSKLSVGNIVIVPNGTISTPKSSSGSKTATLPSAKSYSGYFVRPVAGVKSQGIHGYNAVDIASPVGTSVRASASGKVIIAKPSGYNGGYGLYVVIKHANGTQTLYAHLSQVNVSVGQNVSQGQIIGAIGNTGRSTGPHLHFEVRGAKNPF